MKRNPRTSPSNLRVFAACLLSFMTLMAPIVPVAASIKATEAVSSSAKARTELTPEQKLESYLFANGPLPAATPDVKATMTDADATADGKADFGEVITYTADITNNGPVDATNLSFNAALDPNTEIVAGSVKVSPLAFADTYVAIKDTPLTSSAPGVLGNDTGQPDPTVSAVVGCADVTGPEFTNCDTTQAGGKVTVNVDGSFTYTPPSGFEGTDTFQYTATNGQTPDSTATVTINVDAAPTVTTTSPANGTAGVDPLANITVNFSEPVNVTANTFKIECPTGSDVPFVLTPAAPGGASSFTLDPSAALPGGVTCTVTVESTEVTDVDANDPPDQMAADYAFSFTTDAAPTVTNTTPTNGAPAVATDANVVITFSENVAVSNASFKLECPAGVANAQAFVASGTGTSIITLNPTAELPGGVTCQVTVVANNVSDSDSFDPPDKMAADYVFSFTTDAAPTVMSTTPANNATNVVTTAPIVVNFSEPVTATTSSFIIKCPAANPSAHAYTLSASPSASFTLTPTTPLPIGTTCQVTVVANNISDDDGNDPPDKLVPGDYVFSFTTDFAPTVTATTPLDNATNVSQEANVTITFSEPVNVTNNWVQIVCGTSGTHDTTNSAITGGPTTFTINPNTDFTPGETCVVTVVAAEVADQDGFDPPDVMSSNYVFDFTLDLPPSVSSTTPADNATNIAVGTNIDITFSEAVNATTSSFTIECPAGSGNQAYALTSNGAKTVYTLNPSSNLPAGAECTVKVLAAQVTDVDSGDPPDNMTGDYTFKFKIPPVANADTHPATVVGNVFVNSSTINFSVTTNDLYAAADPVEIDKVQAVTSVVSNTITATTAQGGTVVMITTGTDMGEYTYNPPVGYEGADSFTYQITNDGGSATGTVSLSTSGMVWFINNTAGAGDGRSATPFNSLAAFQAVNDGAGAHPAAGDNIFIYQSATDYVGPVTLLGNQKLIGQDSTSSLQTLTGLNPAPSGGAFPATNSGDATIVKITSGGNAINLNNTNTSNVINGLTVGNTTGIGISGSTGVGFGTLTVADVSIDEPSGTRTGQALGLTTGTVNATFATIETTSAVTGVNLTNINGSITITNGSTSGLTGADYALNGGSANLTYGGTISNSAGRAVDISNKTGGTVDFNGLVTDAGGSGISLQSNAAGTLTRFDAGLTLSTVANNGIVATSGGTLAITDPDGFNTGIANTITTTTGTPLNLTFTDIHSNGLTFKSITSNGAANGIVLNTTGTTVGTHGSLVVTGDGNTAVGGNASGGTIQSSTLSAISLTSTLSPSFTNVTIQGSARNGVDGTGVVNFTFTSGTITNVGTGNAGQYEENAFTFADKSSPFNSNTVSGTVNITKNTITQPRRNGIKINTWDGTISNITVSDNTISGGTTTANIGAGIEVLAQGSASTTAHITTGTFQNNTISGFRFFDVPNNFYIGGIGINVGGGNTAAATSATIGANATPILITNNKISNVGDNFIKFTFNGRTGLSNVNITNNGTLAQPMLNAEGVGMSVYFGGNMTGNAVIDNNFLDIHNRAASSGIAVQSDNGGNVADNTQSFFTITNNRVDHVDGNGIIGIAINNAGDMNIQVKNNTIPTAPTTANRYGIRVAHNSAGPDICADIEGNTTIGSGFSSGIGLRKEGTVPGTNAFGIEGMAATATPNVELYVDGLNTSQPGPPFGDGNGVQLISATSGFTSCSSAPGAMYKPATQLRRDELARTTEPAPQALAVSALAAKLLVPFSDIITNHSSATASVQPAAKTAQAATQKASQPAALRPTTSETVKTTQAQGPVNARTNRAAEETFTSHASVKATAQPAALKAQHSAIVAQPEAAAQPAAKSVATTKALTATPAAAPVAGDLPVTIGTLPSGKTVRVTFQVTVKSAANYTGTNAYVSAQGTVKFDDPNDPPTGTISVLTDDTGVPPNTGETDPTVTPVDSQPDLVLTKTEGGGGTTPGSVIVYTLSYNNTNGKRQASDVVITETVPANTVFNAGSSSAGWVCTPNGNAGSTCTLDIGDLAAGSAGSTKDFAVTVLSAIPAGVTDISNQASIADDGSIGDDRTSADNTANDTTPVTANSDLKLLKSDGGAGVKAGNVATYTLSYSNIGNQGATGVFITETVPADSTFNAGASTAGWTCLPDNNAGSTCTIIIGNLAAGGSGTVTFAVTTSASPVGTEISNTASIDDDNANGPDPAGNDNAADTTPFDDVPTLGNYANASAFVTEGETVTPSAAPADDNPGFDLDVTVSAGFTGTAVVDDVTGVVTITNAGPASASPYTVTITATDSIGQTTVKTFDLTVSKSATTTGLTSSDPTSFNNQSVTFTATVASANVNVPGPPTGSVDFFDGATLICDNAPLDGTGKATCQTSTLDVAGSPHSITATYNGDALFDTSTSSAVIQTIDPSLSITVNTLGDAADINVADEICDTDVAGGEQCTLRAAIQTANDVPSADIIGFSLPAHSTITLDAALDAIDGDLTINGPGADTLTVERGSSAASDFRIFKINAGKTVSITGLTLTGGKADSLDSIVEGNGILNQGTLTLTECVIAGNTGGAAAGGGVSNYAVTSNATLTINNSTISGNTGAVNGGGVSNRGSGGGRTATLTINNSTITGNTVTNSGGGVLNIGQSSGTALLTINNGTIAGNSASINGGGIRNQTISGTATTTLNNTIVSDNTAPTNGPDISRPSGTVNGSFNIVEDAAGFTFNTGSDNQTGVDPLLKKDNLGAPLLENNGGTTKTISLLPGSPALDAGDNALAAAFAADQRGPGFNRVVDSTDAGAVATVDVGAFEAQVSIAVITDKGTAEDVSLAAFDFEVAEDAGITGFTVTATSSNTTLVPNNAANLVLGGAGTTRSLAINPAANQFGQTTITVTVSGTASGTYPVSMESSFVYTVTPVADTPDAADAVTAEDTQSGPIAITKNPADGSEVSHFRVTGITGGKLYMSDGTTQILNGAFIAFADAAGGLRFTPTLNSTADGHFTIQAATGNVIAALGGGTDTSTITVGSANDQPTLNAINGRNILEDAGAQNVNLVGITAGGGETQTLTVTAVSSNPTLIPNPSITYTSPDSTGTLTFTPAADAFGSAEITVTVDDGGGGGTHTVERKFTVNVTAVNDAPSFTKGPNQTVSEDSGAKTINNWATGISAGPNETQTLTATTTNDNNALFSAQPVVSTAGVLTYTPAANVSGVATVSVTMSDNGGTANGGQNTSATQTFTITVTAANDAPVNTVPGPQGVNKNGTLTFSAANSNLVSVADPDAGTNPIRLTLTATNGKITLSGVAGLAFTVGDGTADATMTFTGNQTNVNAALNGMTFVPNLNYTGPASVKVTTNDLGNTGGGALTDADTIAITVSSGGSLSFSAATYTVAEGGSINVTVKRTGGSNGTVHVDYATSNGTATAGTDYTATSGTLTFNNGEVTKTFNILTINDVSDEANETVNLTLSNVNGNGDLGTPAAAVLTITDNDAPPALSVGDATVTEGHTGTTTATFNVTLSAPSGQAVTVNYATSDGTATAGPDYTAKTGTLTFNPGDTSQPVTVLVKGEKAFEADETFTVNLTGAANASVADAQGAGTIENDDTSTLQLSAATYSVNEGGLRAIVTVTRGGDRSTPASINYATSDPSGLTACSVFNGNASDRCDYATGVGTLRFTAGQASRVINIPIVNDVYKEGPENFTLTLSRPVGVELGTLSSATITINDNDAGGAPNPIIGSDEFFIRQLYIDVLMREPDAPGMAGWLDTLQNCTVPANCDRAAVATAFFEAPEFQERAYFAYRVIRASLGRTPRYEELIQDMARVSGFLSAAELVDNKSDYIDAFMQRAEFKQRYNSKTTPTAYVDALLQAAGLATHPQRAAWINGLTNNSLSRADVLRAFVESSQVSDKFLIESRVVMQYTVFLRRDPDAAYTNWITFLQTHTLRELVQGFITSDEYRKRFGPQQ